MWFRHLKIVGLALYGAVESEASFITSCPAELHDVESEANFSSGCPAELQDVFRPPEVALLPACSSGTPPSDSSSSSDRTGEIRPSLSGPVVLVSSQTCGDAQEARSSVPTGPVCGVRRGAAVCEGGAWGANTAPGRSIRRSDPVLFLQNQRGRWIWVLVLVLLSWPEGGGRVLAGNLSPAGMKDWTSLVRCQTHLEKINQIQSASETRTESHFQLDENMSRFVLIQLS